MRPIFNLAPGHLNNISSPLKHYHMAQPASIEEFVFRYFNLPQSALVDSMLYEDKLMDMYNSLYNLHIHTVQLSAGAFTGTHRQLMAKKATIHKALQQRRNKALQQDIELLETNPGIERTVYEWYAVPYWIARDLIDNDEVVLSWKDCYWWGRCTTGQPLSLDMTIVILFDAAKASYIT